MLEAIYLICSMRRKLKKLKMGHIPAFYLQCLYKSSTIKNSKSIAENERDHIIKVCVIFVLRTPQLEGMEHERDRKN